MMHSFVLATPRRAPHSHIHPRHTHWRTTYTHRRIHPRHIHWRHIHPRHILCARHTSESTWFSHIHFSLQQSILTATEHSHCNRAFSLQQSILTATEHSHCNRARDSHTYTTFRDTCIRHSRDSVRDQYRIGMPIAHIVLVHLSTRSFMAIG